MSTKYTDSPEYNLQFIRKILNKNFDAIPYAKNVIPRARLSFGDSAQFLTARKDYAANGGRASVALR